MKPANFSYAKPDNLAGLLKLLDQPDHDIQVLAGGQSLMPMMNFRLAQPDVLVDMNSIDELQFIQEEETSVQIGAMTRYSTLSASPIIANHIPLFGMALPHIAHAAIRNRGTIGGSAALADPAAEMPALLLALDATLNLISNSGERSVLAEDFFLGIYETALSEGEIIKSISIPKAAEGQRFGFYELARRHGDYAMAGVAISAGSSSPVSNLRIAMFAIADRSYRLNEAEQAFEGTTLDDNSALQVAIGSLSNLEFQGDLNADAATKQHLAGIVLQRALKEMVA